MLQLFSLMLQLLRAEARAAPAALGSGSNIFFLQPSNEYTIGAFLHTPPADFSNTVKSTFNRNSRESRF
jgi:hypothetical protein